MITVSEELLKLANIFKNNGFKLYLVGGYVRDCLLSINNKNGHDFDICSSANPYKVDEMLHGTIFKLEPLSKELGVIKIIGKEKYEHATFRREIYINDSHIPAKVEFIKSLNEDAIRRDFKINAIYYDILNQEYIDPLGGKIDIENRVITTTKNPKLVFADDPERILRLIRISCSLNFKIGTEELEYAKKFAENIVYISRGRVRKEFQKILICDTFYPELETKEAHIKAIEMLEEFGILESIFPILHETNISNKYNYLGKKYYNFILNHLKKAKPNLRLPLIFFDLTKFICDKDENKEFDKKTYLENLIEQNIGEKVTNFSKSDKDKVRKTVLGYDFYKTLFTTNKKIRRFIFDNYDEIEEIILLKSYVKFKNEKEDKKRIISIQILTDTKNIMENENVIFNCEDLKISGKELIHEFPKVKLELLPEFKYEIAGKMSEFKTNNDIETIVVIGNKLINSKRDYWLDK